MLRLWTRLAFSLRTKSGRLARRTVPRRLRVRKKALTGHGRPRPAGQERASTRPTCRLRHCLSGERGGGDAVTVTTGAARAAVAAACHGWGGILWRRAGRVGSGQSWWWRWFCCCCCDCLTPVIASQGALGVVVGMMETVGIKQEMSHVDFFWTFSAVHPQETRPSSG